MAAVSCVIGTGVHDFFVFKSRRAFGRRLDDDLIGFRECVCNNLQFLEIADRATVCVCNKSAKEWTKVKTNLLLAAIVSTVMMAPTAWGQRGIEITPFVGGQLNGGLDLSTTLFRNIDVGNGMNYGLSVGYLLGNRGGVEFTWSHNHSDTLVQPTSGGAGVKVFGLNANEYLGYYVLHVNDREKRMRPFILFGAGVTNLGPDRSGVGSITRFTWAFGGGVKYSLSKHLALRLQGKWSPVYINTITNGVWCDPFWAGCWSKGDTLFLHQLDGTAGLMFRF